VLPHTFHLPTQIAFHSQIASRASHKFIAASMCRYAKSRHPIALGLSSPARHRHAPAAVAPPLYGNATPVETGIIGV